MQVQRLCTGKERDRPCKSPDKGVRCPGTNRLCPGKPVPWLSPGIEAMSQGICPGKDDALAPGHLCPAKRPTAPADSQADPHVDLSRLGALHLHLPLQLKPTLGLLDLALGRLALIAAALGLRFASRVARVAT
jgi:hypothetical protein